MTFSSGLGNPDLAQRFVIAAVITLLLVAIAVWSWVRRRHGTEPQGED